MSRHWTLSIVITVLLVATAVEGQRPRRPRGRGPFGGRAIPGGLPFLIAIPEIQEEVGVTAQQRELLEALQEDLQDQRRGMFRGRGGGPPGRRGGRARFDEMRKQIETLDQQAEKLVTAILEPNQTQRLRELRVQYEGTDALDRHEFVQGLGLSDSQQAKIRDLRQSGTFRDVDGDDPPRSAAERDARAAKIMALLSDEQKKRWAAMKGKAFEFPDWMSRSGPRAFWRRPQG